LLNGDKMSKKRALKIKLRDPQPSLTSIGRVLGALPMPGGVRVTMPPSGRGAMGRVEGDEIGQVIVVLPDNGRGDGPEPLPPLPPKLP
jgi:hypothetical protein